MIIGSIIALIIGAVVLITTSPAWMAFFGVIDTGIALFIGLVVAFIL